MAKICPVCSKEYNNDAAFCADCGVALDSAPDKTPEVQPQPTYQQPQYQPQPQHQPQTIIYQKRDEDGNELFPAVKTIVYFLLDIAFIIPFVGFILSIVLSFSPRNGSLKNFARAHLIGYLIILGILACIFIISLIVGGSIYSIFENF